MMIAVLRVGEAETGLKVKALADGPSMSRLGEVVLRHNEPRWASK